MSNTTPSQVPFLLPQHSSTGISNWANCKKCRLYEHRTHVCVMKQIIVNCPTKDYLPARNNGEHIGITEIKPLPPEKLHLAARLVRSPRQLPHILVLGLAPGETEDLLGKPFVGVSGNILYTMFAYAQTSFIATITNTVCCRPIHDHTTTANTNLWQKNRDPEQSEIDLCLPHIQELLAFYKPSKMLCLGEIAQQVGTKFKIPKLNLYHPAYISRLAFKLYTIRTEAMKLRNWLGVKE